MNIFNDDKILWYRSKKKKKLQTIKYTRFVRNVNQYNSILINLAIIRSKCTLPTFAVKRTLNNYYYYLLDIPIYLTILLVDFPISI